MFGQFKKKSPSPLPTLEDIARGLQEAAGNASSMVQQQYALLLRKYFDVAADGKTLVAKVVKIALDDHHFTLVPLVTLVSPNAFLLERMKVKLSLRFEEIEQVRQQSLTPETSTSSSFHVSMAPTSSSKDSDRHFVELELEFKQHPPPEAIMRIIEQFTNSIVPNAHSEVDIIDIDPVMSFVTPKTPT